MWIIYYFGYSHNKIGASSYLLALTEQNLLSLAILMDNKIFKMITRPKAFDSVHIRFLSNKILYCMI